MRIQSTEFDFELPSHLIAQRPKAFKEQKLIVYHRAERKIEYKMFFDLPSILKPGDLLVVNDSKVVPAAIRRDDGTVVFVMQPNQIHMTDIEAICPSKPKVGDVIEFANAKFIVKTQKSSGDIYVGDLITHKKYNSLLEFLEEQGSTPIPPYVNRSPDQDDEKDYQTIFAQYPGSIACPTAGLHFNQELIAQLKEQGIDFTKLTLHVGYGTFKQFKNEFVDEHIADKESYHIPLEALRKIGLAMKEGRRIIAIGTTTTRTLESIPEKVRNFEQIQSDIDGETEIFIYPPFEFKVISGLVTNLAYPKVPVMSLAAAFTGLEELKRIYQAALENDYMFYSYGDAILAL
jgi:S-adenosylmethionine:tRNA ribosyltransferase-isomerase